MLTYADLALRLHLPEGTLRYKISKFNKLAENDSHLKAIKPDRVEDCNTYRKFYFKPESVPAIEAAIQSISTRGRGRPKTKKEARPS